MSGIANAKANVHPTMLVKDVLKDGHMAHLKTARPAPKPFVVCSTTTKRYSGSTVRKTPVQRLSPVAPPSSGRDGPPVLVEARMKQSRRAAALPTVASKIASVEPRRSSTRPASVPAINETTRPKGSVISSREPSRDQCLRTKTRDLEPTKVTNGPREDKIARRSSPPVRSTQFKASNEPVSRPSCVPRGRIPQPFVSTMVACNGNQNVTVKARIPPRRITGIDHHKPCIKTPVSRNSARTRTSVKSTVVSIADSGSLLRAPSPQNDKRLLTLDTITYPSVTWSPPPSPDLSSFPSQSWTVVVTVGGKQMEMPTPTSVCSDETLPGTSDRRQSSSTGTPEGPSVPSESDSSSPAVSPSSTIVSTPTSSAVHVAVDNTLEMGSPRKEASVEVSPTQCAGKIISRSGDGTAFKETLAKMIQKQQGGSPAEDSDLRRTAWTTIRSAFEIAWSRLEPSRCVPQSMAGNNVLKTGGESVSHIRKLMVPPLEKDAKVSSNATIQMEIEMLRARRKVAGGGVVDPRLERLDSLSAMAIVRKHGGSTLSQA